MIRIYNTYHRGGRRESVNTECSHISLAQYSTAHTLKSPFGPQIDSPQEWEGVLLGPFIAWRGVVGPLYPHAQTRSTSLSLGTFQNKHVLAQLGTVKKLALKYRTGKAHSEKRFLEKRFLEIYPPTHSGPNETNEMKGRRLQTLLFSSKLLCRKNQQMDVLSERNKS